MRWRWLCILVRRGPLAYLAVAVRGGDAENFRRKPFIVQYAEPISPLCHPRTSMEKLIFCARKGIPVTYAAGTMMGGTVPVTAARWI